VIQPGVLPQGGTGKQVLDHTVGSKKHRLNLAVSPVHRSKQRPELSLVPTQQLHTSRTSKLIAILAKSIARSTQMAPFLQLPMGKS